MNSDSTKSNGFDQFPWIEALRNGLVDNDRLIRTTPLAEGWAIVRHRGRIIREAMKCFYKQVVQESPPRGVFAIYGLGGTGRQEICPGSDVDVGIVVENIEENEHFFQHVTQQLRKFAPLVPGCERSSRRMRFRIWRTRNILI